MNIIHIYRAYICELWNDYKDGEFCKNIVTNNVDSLIVNEISIKIFTKNNRVYACIEKNANNKNLIKETDTFDKYNKDLYC